MPEIKVLVIDDDETILTLVSTILEDGGFMPICIADGAQGYEAAVEHQPDGIILDRMMPEMDGNDVLIQLKEGSDTKDIPVMMLTSKNDITEVSESLELGARDYIVKPFDNDNLIVRLRNILRRR